MTYKLNQMNLPEWAWVSLVFVLGGLWQLVIFFFKGLFKDNKGQTKEIDELKDLIKSSSSKLLLEIGSMENTISALQLSLNNLEKTTQRDFERMESDMQVAKMDLIAAGRNIAEMNRQLSILNEWRKTIDNKQ